MPRSCAQLGLFCLYVYILVISLIFRPKYYGDNNAGMALSRIKFVFTKYPLLANSFVYGTMCVTAEFSQQNKNDPPEPFDKASLARYAVVGSCINSNILYFWFNWLDRMVPGKNFKALTMKLLLHQFVMTPPLVAAFFFSMNIMEGKDDLFEELKQKFIPTFQRSCGFWLPAQAINFLLVPPMARVVYVATCSFIWVNILCWIKRKEISNEVQ